MTPETFIEKQEESIVTHIFSVSAAMIGVCLTAISIINIFPSFHKTRSLADDITVLDAILFLASCLLSYTAIKTKDRRRRLRIELITDIFFLSALSVMVLVCLYLVYCFLF